MSLQKFRLERQLLTRSYFKLSDDINNLTEDTIFSLNLIYNFIPTYEFGYSTYINILKNLINKLENMTLTREWSKELNDKILSMMKERNSMSLLTKLGCEIELEGEIDLDPGEIEYMRKKNRMYDLKRETEALIVEFQFMC